MQHRRFRFTGDLMTPVETIASTGVALTFFFALVSFRLRRDMTQRRQARTTDEAR